MSWSGRSPHSIVVAPDSFKGSATAAQVAGAIAAGWLSVRPDDELALRPMADGGEGTLDAFEAAIPGSKRCQVEVAGPDDRPVLANYLLLPDNTAVVELASTSGLTLLDRLAPMSAHSRGFGQAIAAALDAGADRLVLALGGSASTDGGTGALVALGARFLDARGEPIAPGGAGLAQLSRVDLAALRAVPVRGVTVLSDVISPLTGPAGAAAVFAPQKGATTAEVAFLDDGLGRLAALFGVTPSSTPGAGAAGGTGFGMLVWGAELLPGAPTVAKLIGLRAASARASLIVTGEGRFDTQSAEGKVVSHVLALSTELGLPVALVAGQIAAPTNDFVLAESSAVHAGTPAAAMERPLDWIAVAAATLAGRWRE